jgi:hypothetical protein
MDRSRSHGVTSSTLWRERPGTFRTTGEALETLELRARNPVHIADILVLGSLGGFFGFMSLSGAASIPGSGGLAFVGFMAMMGGLSLVLLARLALERTVLSLTHDELMISSGVVGTRSTKSLMRSEIDDVESSFDHGWRITARMRDGEGVVIATLTYPV